MMSRAIWQTIDHREADHGEHQGIIRRNTSSSAPATLHTHGVQTVKRTVSQTIIE